MSTPGYFQTGDDISMIHARLHALHVSIVEQIKRQPYTRPFEKKYSPVEQNAVWLHILKWNKVVHQNFLNAFFKHTYSIKMSWFVSNHYIILSLSWQELPCVIGDNLANCSRYQNVTSFGWIKELVISVNTNICGWGSLYCHPGWSHWEIHW